MPTGGHHKGGARPPGHSQVVHLNGINAATGVYLHAPRDIATLAAQFREQRRARPTVRVSQRVSQTVAASPPPGRKSLIGADDSHVDRRTGWGILFAEDESEDVKRALAPLIEHRKRQAGENFRVLEAYVHGCDWLDWLGVQGVVPGMLDPSRIPYYVALVGGPDRIPYGFQYLMDVEYAVGRISFRTADEYAAYAESVVRYETTRVLKQGRWAGFFGTRHADDGATQGSADRLVAPLAAESWDFRTKQWLGPDATKSNLLSLLRGDGERHPPAFVFTATHGAVFPFGNPLARDRNGALVCQEWPGVPPNAGPNTLLAALQPDTYVSAADIGPDIRPHGLIAFHFACFGAGTPMYDSYAPGAQPVQIANEAIVARLPQALMAHPRGGALAVIGHVDRVWSYSFQTPSAGDQIGPFRETIRRIFRGQSVGRAMKEFNERYAALCVYVVCMQQKMEAGEHVEPEEYAQLLTECSDAQNYVILGDPAVSLRVDALS